jgi:phenol hydroxylase P0 protein
MAKHFDTSRKFVRVIETKANGFVEFEFSVGEPEMSVELILKRQAFEEFCAANQVIFLTAEKSSKSDIPSPQDEWQWTLHQATHQRFR